MSGRKTWHFKKIIVPLIKNAIVCSLLILNLIRIKFLWNEEDIHRYRIINIETGGWPVYGLRPWIGKNATLWRSYQRCRGNGFSITGIICMGCSIFWIFRRVAHCIGAFHKTCRFLLDMYYEHSGIYPPRRRSVWLQRKSATVSYHWNMPGANR